MHVGSCNPKRFPCNSPLVQKSTGRSMGQADDGRARLFVAKRSNCIGCDSHKASRMQNRKYLRGKRWVRKQQTLSISFVTLSALPRQGLGTLSRSHQLV